MSNAPEILECTLRDGSYSIDYRFTAEDTAVLAAGLEDAGFRWIEIGHGLGMGASGPRHGRAAATDQEYLEAAAAVLSQARFGMFFIPGIGDELHLRLAARLGAGFVRIGTDVTETEKAERFIRLGKELGLFVCANLMKTYAMPAEAAVPRVKALESWGADAICVVDSAGGMLPDEVSAYVRMLRSSVESRIGFHGHNNLQLAIANCLAASAAGATMLDTTLRGMGRSAGNAQTEILALVLKKRGIETGIDVWKAMDLSERVVGPLVRGHGVDDVAITSGYALFHSSFLSKVYRAAERLCVDPRDLIVRISEIEKVNVTDELVERVAVELRNERQIESGPARTFTIDLEAGRSQAMGKSPVVVAEAVIDDLRTLAAKQQKSTVFTIAPSPRAGDGFAVFPYVRSSPHAVVGNAEVRSRADAESIARAVGSSVDAVLVEADRRDTRAADVFDGVADALGAGRLLTYRDLDAQVQAADALLAQAWPSLAGTRVALHGTGEVVWKLAIKLLGRGANVALHAADGRGSVHAGALRVLFADRKDIEVSVWSTPNDLGSDTRVLVAACPDKPVVATAEVHALAAGGLVLDLFAGGVHADALEAAISRGLRVLRLDMRAGLSAEIACVLETRHLLGQVIGRRALVGVPIVAGGEMGARGDVVVDAIREPSRVIGVADGRGHLLTGADLSPFDERERAVRRALLESRLRPEPGKAKSM